MRARGTHDQIHCLSVCLSCLRTECCMRAFWFSASLFFVFCIFKNFADQGNRADMVPTYEGLFTAYSAIASCVALADSGDS